uniref:Uncharacterized protein n=1 Tax=Raphanus sativus TaxID=3726 RepID=A0A650GC61_RAPSA|nr:hypothetical protein [Raphanus sativus]QGW48590.1 hypothetical protein [Raphanus sativus]
MIQCSLQPASLALSVLSETRSIRSVDRLTFPIEMKGWQSLIDSFLEVKGNPQIPDRKLCRFETGLGFNQFKIFRRNARGLSFVC